MTKGTEKKPKTEQPEAVAEPKASITDEAGEETGPTVQLLVFTLDKEEYATVITDVREITEMADVTEVPNAPTFIEGITNLRGKVVVVVNLEERFRLVRDHPEIKSEHIIIVEIDDATFGVIVDEVTEVLRIPEKNIKKAPAIISAKIGAEFLSGVGVVGERLLLLLDLKKVLSEKELVELAKLAEFHQKEVVVERPKEPEADIEEKIEELAAKKAEANGRKPPQSPEPSRGAEDGEAKEGEKEEPAEEAEEAKKGLEHRSQKGGKSL